MLLGTRARGPDSSLRGEGDHKGFLGAVQSTLDPKLSGNEPERPKAEHLFSRVGAGGGIEQKAQSNEAAWQPWECREWNVRQQDGKRPAGVGGRTRSERAAGRCTGTPQPNCLVHVLLCHVLTPCLVNDTVFEK